MKKYKFSYDKEFDDLFVFNPNSKSKGSVELGELILDFNNKKEFVGLQIMNASKLIKELANKNENIDIIAILNNLKECRIETIQKNNMLMIKLFLISDIKEISYVLSVPSIIETSPSLVYA
ncbi:MAG: DUF2283 domain-containing protein [Nanoarchaeota archaeon]